MNTLYKSSQLINEYLDTVTDEDFLALYNSIATHDGETVDEYLECEMVNTYGVEFSTSSIEEKLRVNIISQIFDETEISSSFTCCANDDYYGLAA